MVVQHTGRLALLALLCTVVAVHGLRRAELVVLAPAPAPAPAAPDPGNVVGVGAATATADTSDAAAQTSKWRVRRGSDPIHNRSR
uniref:Uncharacterized protein n=1 Tax=Oryza brachyantha TaxID=4533 RepID=J3LP84_ORYBR